jgi:response regulator of citrate/malate metabolism
MFDVLIVEDEPACARLLQKCVAGNRWLNLAGTARTRQQAIDAARRLRPALVLLDFGLPESRTAGFDVWRALHEMEPQPDVIAVTGVGEMSTVVKARKCGAFDYVVKPFTPAAMGARLAGFTDHRRRELAARERARQNTIDRLIHPAHREGALPAGLDRVTAESVMTALQAASRPLRTAEIAEMAGVERETANRYLIYLCDQGIADRAPEHGRPGRPAYLYTIAPSWEPAPG